MADKNIVGGIFGMTPEMYSMQRDLAGQQRAASVAQPGTMMNPSLAPFYAQAAQQGQLLGKGIGGLLGVEDPQLAMIRDVQAMKGQFDVSNPAGLRQFAQALGQKGYTDLAIQASGEADKRELTQAQTVRALREPGMQSFEKLVSSGKYTPQSLAQYQQTGNVGSLVLVKGAAGEGGLPKPLPASLQKDEGKDLESYDTYDAQKRALLPSIENLTADAKGVRKLELGPIKNAKYAAQNLAGNSTPESRAYEGLKSAVDTAVNLQVSAEKGVQTDKDVLRFANALIAAYGRNDTEATLDALKRYNDSVDNAQKKVAGRIESRRKSQNVEPYFQGQQQTTVQPAPSAATPATREVDFNSLPKRNK
jgi:hypothetical protein